MTRRIIGQLLGSRGLLLLWIVGIVLPMGWLSTATPATRGLFNSLFAADLAHLLMHLALFAGLALLLAIALLRYHPPRRALFVLAFLAVVVAQEGAQLVTKGRSLGPAEAYDFAIDVAGGAIGLLLFVVARRPAPRP